MSLGYCVQRFIPFTAAFLVGSLTGGLGTTPLGKVVHQASAQHHQYSGRPLPVCANDPADRKSETGLLNSLANLEEWKLQVESRLKDRTITEDELTELKAELTFIEIIKRRLQRIPKLRDQKNLCTHDLLHREGFLEY